MTHHNGIHLLIIALLLLKRTWRTPIFGTGSHKESQIGRQIGEENSDGDQNGGQARHNLRSMIRILFFTETHDKLGKFTKQ